MFIILMEWSQPNLSRKTVFTFIDHVLASLNYRLHAYIKREGYRLLSLNCCCLNMILMLITLKEPIQSNFL